ncbi:nucleotidyl transferase AbiEii/AbiGii toxin family protein [Ohessyouella blattaphilus]|uniref:Nucleotidyl transferase AbiEii/AbiGii toxin family protein n=1 Tax=Ohessyouella blattaphilus TaxID=2949333 RepID=A0ABT1EJP0_9FIRM|nr:nucleotidyl transferase AbiEii/AbiGii toxin family protein [Ohessyouella blattaphilus]MCP1110908.1 nucleotidyl transferase AbiEii/AbiGii toxin family protein [Ohessyouella blattaphilus]MCR8564302.1 nucleotidyl transferase AbiEii/AbiGii toxin family protein [Ohessyouella blattaphilus]
MKRIVKLTNEEKRELFRNTANRMGLTDAIIEKDFWVCYVLDYLFSRSPWKDALVFKGGTSLSKVYHIISRFSEDIDLMIDWRLLGYTTDEPWENRSKTKQDKYSKQMRADTNTFLEEVLVPHLRKGFHEEMGTIPEIYIEKDGLESIVNFAYPHLYDDIYLRPEVRLEIGALAEWSPSHYEEIISYSAEQYPELFEETISKVRTTDVERTFWEKLTILHKVATQEGKSLIPRYARHYYDVYCMVNTDVKGKALKRNDLLKKDINFKSKFYYAKSAGYETAKIGSLKLVPSESTISQLADDYEHMKNMIYGDIPEFNEIIREIAILEKEINTL